MSIQITQKQQSAIVKNLIKLIRKHGIRKYVATFNKKIKFIVASFVTNDFIDYLNKIVHAYHFHSGVYFVANTTDNKSDIRNQKPICKFNSNTNIMTIRLFFFIGQTAIKIIKDTQWHNYVAYVRDFIKQYSDIACGLILDLRMHTGGTMWINIDELQDIFGTTTLIAFGQTTAKKDGWLNVNKGKITKSKFMTDQLSFTKPIAVLVGKHTASTGEFIGAVFYGRQNVKIFGSPTAGFMSVNSMMKINQNIVLNLTTGFAISVDGTFHETERLDNIVTITSKPIMAATKWIQNTCANTQI